MKLLISILACLTIAVKAQSKKPVFLGLQPGITQEQFYPKDEFDVNVIPLVFQTPISKQMDIRLISLFNYHFGGSGGFSDLGLNIVLPYFFKKKEDLNSFSSGIYLAPMLGLGQNIYDNHGTITCAIEPGYMFSTKKRFTLSLSMQLGGSYFIFPNKSNAWHNHFAAMKINLGFWFRRDN